MKKDETEKLRKDLEEMTEMAKRAMADMQNLRRRNEEERLQTIFMANASLVKNLLPVLDNLDRAAAHVPETALEWYKGIEISLKELHKILEETGVKKMETVGKTFDPNFHEAVLQGPGEKDIVIEELEAGYTLNDRVLRHAKVKVGNGE